MSDNISSSDRYEVGLAFLRQIGGENYDGTINAIAETSPDFARFVVEYPYGDVLSRPQLDIVTREAVTVASLMVQGSYPLPINYHLNGFLNVGGSPEALVELCFLAIACLGFPASIDTIGLIRGTFKDREISFDPIPATDDDGTERRLQGLRNLAMHGEDGIAKVEELTRTSPVFAQLFVEFAHGEILTRDGLDAKSKHLSLLSMLAGMGNQHDWLRDHTLTALRQGVTRDEIVEAMIQLSVYSGFPAAIVGFFDIVSMFNDIDAGTVSLEVAAFEGEAEPSETRSERFVRGEATLALTSGGAGMAVVESFRPIAPEIGRMILEHSYGDIFNRDGIDLKTRELAAVSAMAAVGSKTAEVPMQVHVRAAMNVGATQEEVVETLLNLVPYVGYPKVERALYLANEVFTG
ncbi:MAG: carboxymuconolactone decarboxylase family protein [Pseudomonadota bacterium]